MTQVVQNLYCLLATYSVALVLTLSVLLKVLERNEIAKWFKVFSSSQIVFLLVFYVVIVIELVLLAAELLVGTRSMLFSVIVSIMLFLVAAISRYALPNSQGCPCFGTLSVHTNFNGFNVSLLLMTLTAVLWAADHALQGGFRSSLFCLILSVTSASALLVGLKLKLSRFLGKVEVGSDIGKLLTEYKISNLGRNVALIFLSVRCGICMSFLRYLERYTTQFGDKIDFIIFIDGLSIQENMRFGNSTVVADPDGSARRKFRIDKTPSMILPNGESVNLKFVGLDACSLALTRLVIDQFTKQPTAAKVDS